MLPSPCSCRTYGPLQSEAESLIFKGLQDPDIITYPRISLLPLQLPPLLKHCLVGGVHDVTCLRSLHADPCLRRVPILLHLGSCAHHHHGCRLFPSHSCWELMHCECTIPLSLHVCLWCWPGLVPHQQVGSPGKAAPEGVLGDLTPSETHICFHRCNKTAGDCPLTSEMICL